MPGEQSSMDGNSYPGQVIGGELEVARQEGYGRGHRAGYTLGKERESERLDKELRDAAFRIRELERQLARAGEPALDAQYWTERFDVLTNAVDALADKVERSTAPDYDKAFQRGVEIGRGQIEQIPARSEQERNAERTHRERMAKIAADASRTEGYAEGYRHGREVGRAETVGSELLAGGPCDYEVWRDALQLACATITDGPNWSPQVLRENAEWFHEQLLRGAPKPSEPDCRHCGADSSMDHSEDCPHRDEPDGAPNQPDAAADPALTDLADRAAEAEIETTEPGFVPGTVLVTFERIGRHRPPPLTLTPTSTEHLGELIREHADPFVLFDGTLVAVQPPEPGRSIGTGWITSGGRDAGAFTWKAVQES